MCRKFLDGSCPWGENCVRIHPRLKTPPREWLVNVKLAAEHPRARVTELLNPGQRQPGATVESSRSSSTLGPITVKLPQNPTLRRDCLPHNALDQVSRVLMNRVLTLNTLFSYLDDVGFSQKRQANPPAAAQILR